MRSYKTTNLYNIAALSVASNQKPDITETIGDNELTVFGFTEIDNSLVDKLKNSALCVEANAFAKAHKDLKIKVFAERDKKGK